MSSQFEEVEAVIKRAEAEVERRKGEVYLKDGESTVLLVIANEKLQLDKRGGYQMYGIPVEHEGEKKRFYVFLAQVPDFYKVANERGGRVVVKRDGAVHHFA